MALYETYLDARFKEKGLMDSFVENDPEAFVEADVPEDPRADDDRPPSNGDWYPEWNGSTHIPEEFWTEES